MKIYANNTLVYAGESFIKYSYQQPFTIGQSSKSAYNFVISGVRIYRTNN
jgi:hypothetical protein